RDSRRGSRLPCRRSTNGIPPVTYQALLPRLLQSPQTSVNIFSMPCLTFQNEHGLCPRHTSYAVLPICTPSSEPKLAPNRQLLAQARPNSAAQQSCQLLLLSGAAAWPLVARAQQAGKVWRIGVPLANPVTTPDAARIWNAFVEGLREHGYVENQNV